MSQVAEHGFDRWTRRRFGRAAGLAVSGALIGAGLEAGQAKKKKHKKHHDDCETENCQEDGEVCNPYGSPCCDCLRCAKDDEVYRCFNPN